MVRVDASRRARRWNHEAPTPDERLHVLGGSASYDDVARTDDRLVLEDALRALPTRQRQAVVLRYFDDLSVQTVADVMGCSVGTVKSQSAKGLAKLREALDAVEPDRTSTR